MNDQDWGREVFDRARLTTDDSTWVADRTRIKRIGRRRKRLHTTTGAAGALSVVIVASAVGLNLRGPGKVAAPPAAQRLTEANLLQHAFVGTRQWDATIPKAEQDLIPGGAAGSAATALTRLDPSAEHWHGGPNRTLTLDDTGLAARHTFSITFSSGWSAKAGDQVHQSYPVIQLTFETQESDLGAPDRIGKTCGLDQNGLPWPPLGNDFASVHWSSCAVTTLPDGSKIGTSTRELSGGHLIIAVKTTPGRVGRLVVLTEDFTAQGDPLATAPKLTVVPAPWTVQGIVKALSDPAVLPGLNAKTAK
jgi:hypothetical protein